MKKTIGIALGLALIILSGCSLAGQQEAAAPQEKTEEETAVETPQAEETDNKEDETAEKSVPDTSAKVKTEIKAPAPTATQPKLAEPTIKTVSVEAGNLFFKPSSITLKVNQPVKLVVKNAGNHTFTIDELGVNVALDGPSASTTFTPKKTGTFRIYCAVYGHAQAGMVGTITVVE